jgi:ectoine hydroxylase-related dioxygenase (phytanoyl-CoA dioxygenase family)
LSGHDVRQPTIRSIDPVKSHEDGVPVRSLSQQELERFQREGLLTDFQLYSAERAEAIRVALRNVLSHPSTAPSHQALQPEQRLAFDRHLDRRLVYELCTLPQILGPIGQILGNDVMLFRTQFFEKPPHGLEIPWHQESYFWGVAGGFVTMWLAVDDATPENGAMRVITGSHSDTREHLPIPPGSNYWSTFTRAAIPRESDRIVDCSMPAGRFMLFDDLLHNSPPNSTALPRLSFTARYARPDFARVHDHADYPGQGCMMVSGHKGNSGLRFLSPPDNGPGLAGV